MQSAEIAIEAGIAACSNPVAAGESRMPSLYQIGRNLRKYRLAVRCWYLSHSTIRHDALLLQQQPA